MKNKDKQHHESTIGKIIYGFMLFAPLLAILSTCLIYAFNKEIETPSQSAEITYKYETNEVNSRDDLVVGNIYHLKLEDFNQFMEFMDSNDSEDNFEFSFLIVDGNYKFPSQLDEYYIDETYYMNRIEEFVFGMSFDCFISNDNFILNIIEQNYNGDNYILIYQTYVINDLDDDSFYFDANIVFNSYYNLTDYAFSNGYLSKCENVPIESVEITQDENPTEKVFYRAVDYVENSNLFNWAKNSLIYTGISETCNTLSITNTFIPMLLTYWLVMSVLYFLYDIILMILQILHKRIHAVQDSI